MRTFNVIDADKKVVGEVRAKSYYEAFLETERKYGEKIATESRLEQRQETRPHETIVIAPKWETPDEFGLYEIFDDGSFQFLHDILFWALIPTNSKNEIHLCGVDESGLYGYDLEIEDRYDIGWSLDDVEYCMRYEQKGQ